MRPDFLRWGVHPGAGRSYWESPETLDAWRAIAPRPSIPVDIKDGEMFKHEISKSGPPFD